MEIYGGVHLLDMEHYRSIVAFLQVPQAALDVAENRVLMPLHPDIPFLQYGFPPALLPLWSTGSPIYHGYWKHWFSTRRTTLVEMDVTQQRQTREIARSFAQLAREMVLFTISWNEGMIPAVWDFAAGVGISPTEVEQIARMVEKTGDQEKGLLALPLFADDPPMSCFPGDGQGYPGDFPCNAMTLTPQTVRNICTFEVEEDLRREIAALPFAPPWFAESNQSVVFNQLLQQEDYAGAWMSLNSTGWQFPQAKDAMRRLAEQVDVPGFGLLADAWISEPHGATPVTADTTSY